MWKPKDGYTPIVLGTTRGMSPEEFTAYRHHGFGKAPEDPDYMPITIGGSDCGTILGVNPYCSAEQLFLKKLEIPGFPAEKPRTEAEKAFQETVFASGHLAEEHIRNSIPYIPALKGWTVVEDDNSYTHPEYPYVLANLDGRIISPDGTEYVLEIKSTTPDNPIVKKVQKGQPSQSHVAQCRLYMATTNLAGAVIVYAWGFRPDLYMQPIIIPRDYDEEKALFEKLDYFVEQVQDKQADYLLGTAPMDLGIPDFDTDPLLLEKELEYLYGDSEEGKTVELPADRYGESIIGLSRIRQERYRLQKRWEAQDKELEEEEARYATVLMRALKDAEGCFCTFPDNKTARIVFRTQERKSVDSDRLRADGLYETYTKVSRNRKLKVKTPYIPEETAVDVDG